jgi:hypothetical protein
MVLARCIDHVNLHEAPGPCVGPHAGLHTCTDGHMPYQGPLWCRVPNQGLRWAGWRLQAMPDLLAALGKRGAAEFSRALGWWEHLRYSFCQGEPPAHARCCRAPASSSYRPGMPLA